MKFYNDKFKVFRIEKKVPISVIAENFKKSRKTIWTWETGKVIPKPSEIIYLANLIGVEVSEISDLSHKRISNRSTIQLDTDEFTELSTEKRIYIENLKKQLKEVNLINSKLNNKINSLSENIDNLQAFIYTKDNKHILSYINRSFLIYLGKDINELLGKNFSHLFSYGDFSIIHNMERNVIDSGEKILNAEIDIPGSKNRLKGLLNISPIFNKDGRVESITSSILNITDTKIIKNKLLLLETCVSKLDEVFWIKQSFPDEKLLFLSDFISDIYSIDKNNIMNNLEVLLTMIHPEDLPYVKKQLKAFEQESNILSLELKYRIMVDRGREVKHINEKRFKLLDTPSISYGIIREVTALNR
ncbi:MAG: PAS domain-containing protein [bacterium]|nr:PAS domain-containing protein [bacterium]